MREAAYINVADKAMPFFENYRSEQRIGFLRIALAVLILLSAASELSADVRTEIRQATKDFRDITLTCKVLYANHAELRKIGKDFPKSYEFKTTTVRYKAPDKMKMEGKLGLVQVIVVINGDKKAVKVPSLHITKKENISKAPHKRQGDLDIGILTEQLWFDYIVTGVSIEQSSEGEVCKLSFVRSNARNKKMVLWADTKTWKLLKLEKYEDDGRLKSRYIYSNHKRVGCIWVPCHVDVYNGDGKLAASTMYTDIRVNSGIPDSEFNI